MKKLLIVLAFVLMLTGCQSKLDLITVNDDIPSKKTNNVDAVLRGLTTSIQNSDLEAFTSLCVPGTEELNTIYFNEFINNGRLFIDFFLEKNFEKENRYYITDITKQGESTAYASEGYEFIIPSVENAEGSRYIYIVEGEYNNFDILLTVVLAENEGDFKIERFTLGDIRPYDESVVTLIDKADAFENDNKLISAWQFNELAAQFVSPSPYVYFADDERISNNMERVAGSISDDLTFPIDVQINEDTFVKLYAIASNKYEDGFYCRVIYVSNVPENQASDDMIKVEAKQLHEKASQVLNGLGDGFNGNILYTAYFEEPLDQGKDYTTVTVDLKE